MKKKFLLALLGGVCVTACAASFAGCDLFGGKPVAEVTDNGIKYELTNADTYCATGFENAGDTRETLIIPEKVNGVSVTDIAQCAFEGSTSLKSVSIPASVINCDSGVFKGCMSIESMTLPFVGGRDDGWSIGYNFSEDANADNADVVPSTLKSVTILSQTRLRGGDFKDCTALESVTLPDTLEYVGRFVFENCTALKEIVIPESVTEMEYAFTGCTALESLTVPFVGQFKNPEDYVQTTRWNFGYFFDGTSSNSGVPESLKNVSITSAAELRQDAFKDCANIEKAELPATLAEIGDRAFMGCTSLKSINVPSKITKLNDAVFYGCENLEISVHEKVTAIGSETFENCTDLKITLTEGLLTIGNDAFANCVNLEISIPHSVTNVASGAFKGCTNALKEVNDAFYVDNWLISASGETVYINDGTVGVAAQAFTNALREIVIPESVVHFSTNAFYNARSGLSVCYDGDIESWCGITFGNSQANPLYCAYDLKTAYGSEYVSALTIFEGYENTLEIPEGVTKLGEYVFAGYTNLKAVFIPDSVTEIADTAFYGCNGINDIIYGGTLAEWNEFANLSGNYTVHCTDGDV